MQLQKCHEQLKFHSENPNHFQMTLVLVGMQQNLHSGGCDEMLESGSLAVT